MNLTLSLPQFLSILIAILGSFTGVFWALQRYVGSRVDKGLEEFDEHASRLEDKLDAVVSGLADLKNALTGVSERHAAKIDGLERRVDRLDSRLAEHERSA